MVCGISSRLQSARQQVRRNDAAVGAAVSPTCLGYKADGRHSAERKRCGSRLTYGNARTESNLH